MNHVHEILPRLYLGDHVAASNVPFLREKQISLVVNVTRHIPNYFETMGDDSPGSLQPLDPLRGSKKVETEYLRIPVEDNLEPTEIQELYRQAVSLIPHIDEAYRQGRPILFHCHAGQQRSAALMVMFLMYHFQKKTKRPYSSRDAIFYVTSKRPIAFQGGRYVNFQEAIDRYETYLQTHPTNI